MYKAYRLGEPQLWGMVAAEAVDSELAVGVVDSLVAVELPVVVDDVTVELSVAVDDVAVELSVVVDPIVGEAVVVDIVAREEAEIDGRFSFTQKVRSSVRAEQSAPGFNDRNVARSICHLLVKVSQVSPA
ncbi:hypothetical protein APSETT444_001596 [Aspergillus pseudonomiae]